MLRSAQFAPETSKVKQANPVVAEATHPCRLAEQMRAHVHQAWLEGGFSKLSPGGKVEALQTYLGWLDKAVVAYAGYLAEDKRMVAACEAFSKVLAKG